MSRLRLDQKWRQRNQRLQQSSSLSSKKSPHPYSSLEAETNLLWLQQQLQHLFRQKSTMALTKPLQTYSMAQPCPRIKPTKSAQFLAACKTASTDRSSVTAKLRIRAWNCCNRNRRMGLSKVEQPSTWLWLQMSWHEESSSNIILKVASLQSWQFLVKYHNRSTK